MHSCPMSGLRCKNIRDTRKALCNSANLSNKNTILDAAQSLPPINKQANLIPNPNIYVRELRIRFDTGWSDQEASVRMISIVSAHVWSCCKSSHKCINLWLRQGVITRPLNLFAPVCWEIAIEIDSLSGIRGGDGKSIVIFQFSLDEQAIPFGKITLRHVIVNCVDISNRTLEWTVGMIVRDHDAAVLWVLHPATVWVLDPHVQNPAVPVDVLAVQARVPVTVQARPVASGGPQIVRLW
jgi:hypothetical protein